MRKIYIHLLIAFLTGSLSCWSQVPSIQSFRPHSATVDETIEITGANFGTDKSKIKVFFGAVEGEVKMVSETQIKVLVPPGSTYDNLTVLNTSNGLAGISKEQFLISFGGSGLNLNLFGVQKDYPADVDLTDHCVGDFNMDGKVDMATAHLSSKNVCVFKNISTLADINFNVKTIIPVGFFTVFIRSGDIDGDGKLDLIASKYFSKTSVANKIFVLKNTTTIVGGDITFAEPKEFSVTGDNAKEIVVQDLDADGKPEIIVSNDANNIITILKNQSIKGTIDFSPNLINVTVENVKQLSGLSLSDLNGDGLPELIMVPYFGPNIYIKPNVSALGFVNFDSTKTVFVSGAIIKVAVGDLNKDSKPDLAVTRVTTGDVSVVLNKTTTIGGKIIFDGKSKDFLILKKPVGIDIGDIDGDGLPDITVASVDEDKKIGILRNTTGTDGVLNFYPYTISTKEASRSIKVADLNGDGRPDLSFTSISSPQVSVIKNRHTIVPAIWPNNKVAICTGQTKRLNAIKGRGIKYIWVYNSLKLGNPDTLSHYDVKSTTIGEYQVIIQDRYNSISESSNTTAVILNTGLAASKPNPTNSGAVCVGGSVTLIAPAKSDAVYQWSGPNGWISNEQKPVLSNMNSSMTGSYVLSIKTGNCISESDTTVVTLLPSLPVVNIVPSRIVICDGGEADLTIGDIRGFSYQWKKNGTSLKDSTSYSMKIKDAAEYSIDVTSTSGCSTSSKPVLITKLSTPKASFTGPQNACKDIPVQFKSSITGLDASVPVSYAWNLGGYVPRNSTDAVSHTFTKIGTYTITFKITYGGCDSEISQQINIGNKLDINITSDKSEIVCQGEPVVLTAEEGFTSYKWNTGAQTISITVTTPATYSVEVQNSSGCSGTGSIDVKFLEKPELAVKTDNTNPINLGDSVQLTASGALSYKWSPEAGLSNPNIANPKASPRISTKYVVTGYSKDQCADTLSIPVNLLGGYHLFPANVFSPNGDTKNEKWQIGNIENYEKCKVIIFNRQGQKVYEAMPYYNNEWDGKMNGKDMPEGAYYFVIQCNEEEKAKAGSLTLIR